MPSSSDTVVSLTDVTKRFGAVVALRGASLSLKRGEVRALMGGNGSGKSTLSKVLLGMVAADEASVVAEGTRLPSYGPAEAARLRVAGTYQEISLLDDLTVLENLFLTEIPRRLGLFAHPGKARATAVAALDRVLLPSSVLDRKVRDLPLDQRAIAELAKVLLSEPRIIVMDELTASLRQEHVEMIGALVKELSAEGVSTVFVSHRLEEVEEFCTSATVLRNGRTVLEADRLADHSMSDYLAAMTATTAEDQVMRTRHRSATAAGAPVLTVEGMTIPGWSAAVDLTCHEGEIVGLAGLTGNGQSDLLRSLFGATGAPSGTVTLGDRGLAKGTVREAISSGVGFMSGDREREMSFGQRSVEENVGVVSHAMRRKLSLHALLDRMKIVGHPKAAMRGLSGGNQQKVIVGRWLGYRPKVLLADDPTRGVDVATRTEIHRLFRELTDTGSTILLTSSDERELAEICDRVYVLYRGGVIAELAGDEVDEHSLAQASLDPELLAKAK